MPGLSQIWSVLLGCAVATMPAVVRADINPVTGEIGGDAAPQSFAEYCRGTIGPDRVASFNAEIGKAEQALAAGNQEVTEVAMLNASQAVWRGGNYDDLSVRCLGEEATRRWHNLQLELWRRGWWGTVADGLQGSYPEMYVIAADRGSDGLVEVISHRPAKDFLRNYQAVADIAEMIESRDKFGTTQIPEERAIGQVCREALEPLQKFARTAHANALVAEDKAFTRPPTQMEREAAEALGGVGELALAMGGMDINTADQQQALVVLRQTEESMQLLQVARDYEIEPVFGPLNTGRPSFRRAERRGDTMLMRANNEELSLEVRDDYYAEARDYFGWCKCRDKDQIASKAKESIQPALQAKAERQQEKMDKMQAEMQLKAEAMKKSVEDKKKTDAEKQSFKDEAEALEDELDF